MKKIIIMIIASIAILLPTSVKAEEKINVYIFSRTGCHFCQSAKEFFAQLAVDSEYGQYFTLVDYNIYENNNDKLAEKVAKHFGDKFDGVPYIIIGDKTYSGYSSNYDDSIKAAIKKEYNNSSYTDTVASIKENTVEENEEKTEGMSTDLFVFLIILVVFGIAAFIYFAGKQEKK